MICPPLLPYMWVVGVWYGRWRLTGPQGEYDGGEGGFGGVEAVGASDDESNFVVESFVASIGQATIDGGDDPVSLFPDSPGRFYEFVDSAMLRLGAPAVEEGIGGAGV